MDIYLKKSDSEELKEKFINLSSREDIADLLEISDKNLVYYLYRLPDEKKYHSFELPKKMAKQGE